MTIIDYYHPYKNSLANISKFKLVYKPDIKNLTIADVKNLDLKTVFKHKYTNFKNKVNNHNKLFDIDGIYERHKDITEDILYNSIVYNECSQKSLNTINGLFKNNDRLLKRYLIGNYAYSEEILERPLAKFTQDIARQLGLLK